MTTPDTKAERAATELKALIREAHESARDLTAVRKDAASEIKTLLEVIDGRLAEEVGPMVTAFTTDTADKLQRWLDRLEKHFTEKLVEQMLAWNTEIYAAYRLPGQSPGVVIDLREGMPHLVQADTPEGAAILAEAPYQVVINPDAISPPQPPTRR